ncbi:MAG TPA: hypothetical protein PLF26_14630 [Blastocatellia bacterium]|nr:hypothetical protein [Blastocatellia bacterium]
MKRMLFSGVVLSVALAGFGCGAEPTKAPAPAANKNAAPVATNTPPATPSATAGTPVKLDEAGLSYVVPTGWSSETGEGYALVASGDKTVRIALLIPKEGKTEATQAAIEEAIKDVIKNAKADGKPEETTLDGMPVSRVTGTGEHDGKQVKWVASRIQATKTLFVIAFGTPDDMQKHQSEIDSLRASVKKIG